MDPTRTRFATVAFSQMEDLNVLNSLIDELSAVLLSNQEATDRLCLTMDELLCEPDESEEGDSGEVTGREPAPGVNASEEDLALQNESLRVQVENQKIRNRATQDLLMVCVFAVDKVLGMVRQFAHDRTMYTFQLHRQYVDQLQQQQQRYQELAEKHALLEDEVYKISRRLGGVLRKTMESSDIETSLDFLHGKRQIGHSLDQ
jgi:hypothetical protein